jgi:hypothetical protein
MRHNNSRLLAFVVCFVLLVSACGGSADPDAPEPTTTSANTISEDDAVAKAEAVASDQGLSAEGLDVKPGLLFGEWQVSFEPVNTGSLTGGFLVVLDAETGEVIDVVTYQ